MNRYSLTHVTQFDYDAPVTDNYNEVRLRPLQDDLQSCLSFRLITDPPTSPGSHLDYYGNTVHHFNVLREHRHLRIAASSLVLVQPPPLLPERGFDLKSLSSVPDSFDEYYDLLNSTDYVPHDSALGDLGAVAQSACDGTCAGFAVAAMRLVHETFRYEKGATHVHSSICDTLRTGAGVCQDFAHILLAIVRMRGLPGRYVSGYLVPPTTSALKPTMEEVIGGQASHAWMEVFIPEAGWFGLDPTLGSAVGMQHVRLAYGRDYGDVAPIRGVYRGNSGQHMSVDVGVRPALDDEGCEHLQERTAVPRSISNGLPQQPQQQ